MNYVSPKVHLIGATVPDIKGIAEYLRSHGYDEETIKSWESKESASLQDLIEFFGRLCYASFDPTLNQNISRIRKDQHDYLQNIIKSGHGSVLESAQINFVVENCSRVLTHELIRHRVGTHISQESMRYVRLEEWGFVYPESFSDTDLPDHIQTSLKEISDALISNISLSVSLMGRLLELDSPEKDFHYKKRHTSSIRRFLPNGVATQLGWSANIRTLRHVISMRSDDSAEEEIREFAHQLMEICQKNWPSLFSDFEEIPSEYDGAPPQYRTKYRA